MKKTSILILLFLTLSLLINTGQRAVGAESLESKIKKIVMMLNIVSKEYKEGIQNGQIVNAAEYEESQIFLEQALDRFESVSTSSKNPETVFNINHQFSQLTGDIKSKVSHVAVRGTIDKINAQLLKEFGIQIQNAPTRPVSLENGRTLYESNCKVCHGISGNGDGPLAAQFDPAPAVLSNPQITGDADTAAYDNFQVISVGIANTAMIGWADTFPESDRWDITYYIRSFSNENVKLPLISAGLEGTPDSGEAGDQQADQVIAEVRNLLDRSFVLFKEQNIKEAAESAFDAYLTYEKIESGLINKNKTLGLRLESDFSRYRGEIKRGAPVSQVENIRDGIQADLSKALETLKEQMGFTGLFIQSFAIILREGFEAILIIAALIAFLVKSNNQDKLKSIYSGVILGVAGSFLTAYLIHEVLNISLASQELMEGIIMLVAVALLFSVSYWLVSKIQTEKWQQYITGMMKQAISTGSMFTLGAVAFLSVYREGFETVLFYKALYTYAGGNTAGILPGFLLGALCLGVIYYLVNKVGVRIPIKWFFVFTSAFLYYMAFTFMGKGLHELQMAEALGITPINGFPQIPWMGVYPSWETLIGQGILLLAYVLALVYTFGIKSEIESKELKTETSNIQRDISVVHDLVEHISHHAKRCEIFLKDTKDQDLKELSEHLKEIDSKVHELSDHVQYVENQLLDEFDRIGRSILPKEKEAT